MSHELKPLPYAPNKLEPAISAEVVLWHHDKHQAGYVSKRNEIEEKLKTYDRSAANMNYSDYGELKRRESFNASGHVLHELYWDTLGGDGKADRTLPVVEKLVEDFGSIERWAEDMKACAKASLGWAILCFDPSDGKLHNFLCDLHNDGAVWGAIPITAIDVFEHAYYRQYGPDRATYIEGVMKLLNWEKINERYEAAVRVYMETVG